MKQKRNRYILARLTGIIALVGVFLIGAMALSPHGNAYAHQVDGTSCLLLSIGAGGGINAGGEEEFDLSIPSAPIGTSAKGTYTYSNTNTGAKVGQGNWSASSPTPYANDLPLPPTGQQYEYDFSGTTNGGQCVSGFVTIS